MQKITSFTVDHTKLECGMYVSRVDGDITTYDLRHKKPNVDAVMDNETMHTLEHMLATFLRNSEISEKIINAYMPGPLTIILKKKDNVDSRITNNQDTIAIRIPLDPTLLKIVKGLKEPILLTSANKSGEQSCINSEEVEKIFKDEVPLIIKGKCKHNYASTIVEIKDKNVNIIREGVIKKEEIERLIKVCE